MLSFPDLWTPYMLGVCSLCGNTYEVEIYQSTVENPGLCDCDTITKYTFDGLGDSYVVFQCDSCSTTWVYGMNNAHVGIDTTGMTNVHIDGDNFET